MQTLDLQQARRSVLRANRLADRAAFADDESAILNCIEHLGYMQIDAISVVRRAHLHGVWVRTGSEDPAQHLDNLQRRRRQLFEYWAHAAAYLPMCDYRYSLPLMAFFKKRSQERGVTPEMKRLQRRILSAVRANGAMQARDFEAPPDFKGGGWWRHKPAKQALQSLFFQGALMISHRKGFEKVYDLPERVLPADIKTHMPTPKDQARHIIYSALRAQAVITYRDLLHPLRCTNTTAHRALPEEIRKQLAKDVRDGLILERSIANQTAYLLPETLEDTLLETPTDRPFQPVKILSPFDNLVIQRNRLKWLFGFDYRLECYVPEPKRQFGYFALPILQGTDFLGRMDAVADTSARCLKIKSLHLEVDARTARRHQENLLAGLSAFACFNACEQITFTKQAGATLSFRKLRYSVT